MTDRNTGQAGAVYVEFLIAVIPLIVLFTGLVQLGLVYGVRLMVGHAAAKAARAAVVILPDDAEGADYEGVPLNAVGNGGEGLDAYRDAPDNGRYQQIRSAARMILSPFSPGIDMADGSVASAIDGSALHEMALSYLAWTSFAVGLGFVDEDGAYVHRFDPRHMIRTRVVFLFRCRVPVANRLMCRRYGDLDAEFRQLLEVNSRSLALGTRLSGWRFMAVEATRMLPNQGRRR